MSNTQTWAIIVAFAAAVFTMLGIVVPLVVGRIEGKLEAVEGRLTCKIDGVEGRLTGKIDSVESRLNAKIDGVEASLGARIETLTHRVDGLDRDVQTLFKRTFGE